MHINKEVETFIEDKRGKVEGHNRIYWKNKSLFKGNDFHLSDNG